MNKKLPYMRLWQAELLNRKIRKDAIPIDISSFRKVKGNIGLHGYRRIRTEGTEDVREYRKDTYGTTLMFINIQDSTIETKTETWVGLMAVCDEFDLSSYRHA